MKKKAVWLVVTGGMVAALLLASCAPPAVKEAAEKAASPAKEKVVVVPKAEAVPKEEERLVKWTMAKLDGTVVEKMIEKPRYGGIAIVAAKDQPSTFDDTTRHGGDNVATTLVNEALMLLDWRRSPSGTREYEIADNTFALPNTWEVGGLATKWEIPEPNTLAFRMRKGVHFALDPASEASRLVGGRELTAADVVYGTRRMFTKGNLGRDYPYLADMKNVANSIYVAPDDPWTVVIKTKPGQLGGIYRHASVARNKIIAPEVIEKYGELTTGKWQHVVGTGPMILKEYVGASTLTYVRNPNYWDKDPFFPDNQLPYLDGVKYLIIPDESTRMAAIRAGKVDSLSGSALGETNISSEDFRSLIKTHPSIGYTKTLASGGVSIHPRNDTKPFDDVRVRRALMLAINKQEILDEYWGGDAELFVSPVTPTQGNKSYYVPLEQMPESVKELYGYHPDKAKQLLAEAGYPQGFQTEIIARAEWVDILSIVKEYWAKIGVDLKIEVRDPSTITSIQRNMSHKQILADDGTTYYQEIWTFRLGSGASRNYQRSSDQWVDKLRELMFRDEYYFNPIPKLIELHQKPISELIPEAPKGLPNFITYFNEQVWFINLPQPYVYDVWQPWLKGYNGMDRVVGGASGGAFGKHAWLDQELKKAMGR